MTAKNQESLDPQSSLTSPEFNGSARDEDVEISDCEPSTNGHDGNHHRHSANFYEALDALRN